MPAHAHQVIPLTVPAASNSSFCSACTLNQVNPRSTHTPTPIHPHTSHTHTNSHAHTHTSTSDPLLIISTHQHTSHTHTPTRTHTHKHTHTHTPQHRTRYSSSLRRFWQETPPASPLPFRFSRFFSGPGPPRLVSACLRPYEHVLTYAYVCLRMLTYADVAADGAWAAEARQCVFKAT